MKYKLIGLSATTLTLIAVIFISMYMPKDNGTRYIEHILAEEKTECTSHSDNTLCSHLPIVNINTNGAEIPGKPVYDEEFNVIDYTLAQDGTTSIRASLGVINDEKA